jgi:hypothetical protein
MFQDNTSLATMAEALSRSTDYRVLRRLVPRTTFTPSVGESTKTGILLDVETTGLDPRKDEVIELGMVKFDYLPDGRVIGVSDVFSSFNEPSVPIPSEVTALTGITGEMVAGQRIDEGVVSAFVEDVVIVIAHNAGFNRKFAERYWPIFERKAWGCSATRGRMAQTRLRRFAPRLPSERRRLLPPSTQGCRRLSCLARDPRARPVDDGHASTRRPVGAGPKEDDEDLGGTVAIRPERHS